MHVYLLGLVWVVVAYVLHKIVTTIIGNHYHAVQAKRLGCQPAHVRKDTFLGIGGVRRALRAQRDYTFPNMLVDVYHEQGGATTWIYQALGTYAYFTVDPVVIKAILATQFEHFGHGNLRRVNFIPFLGEGILSVNGKRWEHSRAMLRPQFAKEQISDLDLEERHLQDMLLHIPANASGWTPPVDLQEIFYRFTLDSATEFLFGESSNSQLASLPEDQRPALYDAKAQKWSNFAPVFDKSTTYCTMGILMENFGRVFQQLPHVRNAYKRVHEFADFYVTLASSNSPNEPKEKASEEGHKKKFSFLGSLIEQTRDPIVLRSEILNMLIAGRDTTASLLGFLFHALAQDSACFNKLRAVILEDFGTYEAPNEITFSCLKSCKYLQWCLNETLRIYNPVTINSRTALQNATLPRGGGADGQSPVYVRQGQEIFWATNIVHTRKDIWGPDVDEFKPERWQSKKTGWEYIPFNGGARTCIGQQFSLTEASYVTVRLLQRFDRIENLDAGKPVRYNQRLISSLTEVNVRLHRAVWRRKSSSRVNSTF